MTHRLWTLTIAAALAAGASGAAVAQTCPSGQILSDGVCQPAAPPAAYAPSNPVTGAAAGGTAGAATGAAAAGPVGAVVGGAVGTATGTVAGTVNAVTGAPTATTGFGVRTPSTAIGSAAATTRGNCPAGSVLYLGYCYPAS